MVMEDTKNKVCIYKTDVVSITLGYPDKYFDEFQNKRRTKCGYYV